MSEYQYYEFCKLNAPLTAEAKKEMASLSSRAKVSTHGASYVYNFGGGFRGKPKELLLKYFDVYFYIANWGSLQLMFKYSSHDVDVAELKKYCVKNVIQCETRGSHVILNLDFNNEDGFGWLEGEGMLSDLLPLYDEIKAKNYQFLSLLAIGSRPAAKSNKDLGLALSDAQKTFFKYAEIG